MKKKAVCVGVSYATNSSVSQPLSKAHDDAYEIRRLLMDTYEYKDVKLLLDCDSYKGRPPNGRPTRNGIMKAMRDLVKGVEDGDRLVFHYSGHGSQQPDQPTRKPRETDGLDEMIWPEDVEVRPDGEKNIILDNDIHDILVEGLPTGAHLTIIFDCCHSGTAADLPDIMPRGNFKTRKTKSGREPRVVSLSACQDPQQTLEFQITGGLLVYYLCKILKVTPHTLTYAELWDELFKAIKRVYEEAIKKANKINKDIPEGIPEPVISILGDCDSAMVSKFGL